MTESDLRTTLNLPKTDFPMKANLPQAEPRRLARWKEADLYGQLRKARSGRPSFVLHDGPPYANGHIHIGTTLNKVLKDVVVRSRSMAGHDAPYRPGWDCHGLPIELKVERDLGSKKRDMSPVAFRQACRAYADKFMRIQREEFERLGVMGEWDDPYLTMAPGLPGHDRAPARDIRREGARLQGQEVGPLVHLVPHRARRGGGRVRREPREPADRRALRARGERGARGSPRASPPSPAAPCLAVAWTTTPWTLPANLALAFHPEADYALLPGRGPGRGAARRQGARRGCGEALRPDARGAARRAQGRGARALQVPPSLDRPRLARRPGRLRDARHRHRGRPHGARPRLGRLPHRRPLRPRHLLPGRRGRPLPARGRALRRQARVRGEPARDRAAAREGCARPGGQGQALLPGLLALQAPDHLPRDRAVVHRPRRGPPDAARAGARRDRRHALAARPGARSASTT